MLLLSPFAPHVAEEMWMRLGRRFSIVDRPWPVADAAVAREEELELAVQVERQGARRTSWCPRTLPRRRSRQRALAEPRVASTCAGKQIVEAWSCPGPPGQRGGRSERGRAAARLLLPALAAGPQRLRLRAGGPGHHADPSIKRIGVPLFRDSTGKAGLDQKITAEGHRGAAQARPLRRRPEHAPAWTRWWTASSLRYDARPGRLRAARVGATRTQASRYAITLTATRHATRRSGADGADLGQRRRSPSATNTTSAPTPARSSTARSRPWSAWPRLRPQPRRRDAGGVLTPPTQGAAQSRGAGVHAIVGTDSLAGRAGARGAPAQALGRGRPRRTPSRSSAGTRRPGRACSRRRGPARCSRRGGPWSSGRRTRSRATATSCPPAWTTRARTRGSSCWPPSRTSGARPGRSSSRGAQVRVRGAARRAAPLRGYVAEQVRRRKLALGDEAFEELLERVGQDLRRLMGELDKLEAFAGGPEGAAARRRRWRRCWAGAWPSRSTSSATRSPCGAASAARWSCWRPSWTTASRR